jgi:hypothetical protein
MAHSTGARWLIRNGRWTFGVSDADELFKAFEAYTMEGIADRVTCPTLVLEAENDQFFAGQPRRIFDALTCPKELITFPGNEGGGEHCQEGAMALFHQRTFDWLDSAGDDIDNPRLVELVGELALSSERFRTLWARHDVRGLEGGTTTVHHPVVGELRLHRDKLPVGDVLLVLYYADQGSDSDEKLRLLASIAQAAPTPVEPLTRADRLPGC